MRNVLEADRREGSPRADANSRKGGVPRLATRDAAATAVYAHYRCTFHDTPVREVGCVTLIPRRAEIIDGAKEAESTHPYCAQPIRLPDRDDAAWHTARH
jgi:hypothetical protein